MSRWDSAGQSGIRLKIQAVRETDYRFLNRTHKEGRTLEKSG